MHTYTRTHTHTHTDTHRHTPTHVKFCLQDIIIVVWWYLVITSLTNNILTFYQIKIYINKKYVNK